MKKILIITAIFTVINWSVFATKNERDSLHCEIETTCLMKTSECVDRYPNYSTVIILRPKLWENNYVIRMERWKKKHICIAINNGQFNTTTYNTYENKKYDYNQYSTLNDCQNDLNHQLDIYGCFDNN